VSWGFPWRFSSLLLYDTEASYPPERAQRLIQMRYLLRVLIAQPLGGPGTTNFLELRQAEVRRILLLGSWVNKGKREGRGHSTTALQVLRDAKSGVFNTL
jgi:hypothetical protein